LGHHCYSRRCCGGRLGLLNVQKRCRYYALCILVVPLTLVWHGRLLFMEPPASCSKIQHQDLCRRSLVGGLLPLTASPIACYGEESAKSVAKQIQLRGDVLHVARPLKYNLRKVFSVDIPIVKGIPWGEYYSDEDFLIKAKYEAKFGSAKEAATQVVVQLLKGQEENFTRNILDYSYTYPGTGIISNVSTEKTYDLEWIDSDVGRKNKKFLVHNVARILYNPRNGSDLLLLMQVPETQVENLKILYPPIRDSLKFGA